MTGVRLPGTTSGSSTAPVMQLPAPCSPREQAEGWINANGLQGTLTKYPVDVPVYDFAIQNGWFTQKSDRERSGEFIQRFSSASMEHYHYDGDASGLDPEEGS